MMKRLETAAYILKTLGPSKFLDKDTEIASVSFGPRTHTAHIVTADGETITVHGLLAAALEHAEV